MKVYCRLLLFMVLSFSTTYAQGEINFEDYFTKHTLRIDYLHVGNADGVSVEYNGEIKDIINYPRQRKNRRIFVVGSNN